MKRALWRKLLQTGMVAILAIGFVAVSGRAHPVAAEVTPPSTCEPVTYPRATIALNAVSSVSFGMTARACTNGKISWNWSSSYPSNCWVSYSPILDVTGVCGYAGNLTYNFRYISNVMMYNRGGTIIKLGLTMIGVPTVMLPAGYKFPCTVTFTYDPYTVLHGQIPAGYGSCGPMSPIWF